MKAMTLKQPWAQLVVVGAKRYEARSWKTSVFNIGTRIVIHAAETGKILGNYSYAARAMNRMRIDRGDRNISYYDMEKLARRAIVGTVILKGIYEKVFSEDGFWVCESVVDCSEVILPVTSKDARWCPSLAIEANNFVFEFCDPEELDEAIPCAGGSRLWRCDLEGLRKNDDTLA